MFYALCSIPSSPDSFRIFINPATMSEGVKMFIIKAVGMKCYFALSAYGDYWTNNRDEAHKFSEGDNLPFFAYEIERLPVES